MGSVYRAFHLSLAHSVRLFVLLFFPVLPLLSGCELLTTPPDSGPSPLPLASPVGILSATGPLSGPSPIPSGAAGIAPSVSPSPKPSSLPSSSANNTISPGSSGIPIPGTTPTPGNLTVPFGIIPPLPTAAVHKVGVGLITTAGGYAPTQTLDDLKEALTVQQFNPIQWWTTMSGGKQTLNFDILETTLLSNGSNCDQWHQIALSAFKAAGGRGTYDSYIWVWPDAIATGCNTPYPQASFASELGPCPGGCHNDFYGVASPSTSIFAIGRNKGLTKSTALNVPNGDLSCPMGRVLNMPNENRRGFNALKLKDLGLLNAVDSSQNSFSQYLTDLYSGGHSQPVTKLLHLTGTSLYLSFRGARNWGIERNNNLGEKWMSGFVLSGTTHVHQLNQDGSSTLLKTIADGETYSPAGSSFTIRQDWSQDGGAQLSIANNGNLPAPIAQPQFTIPATGIASAYADSVGTMLNVATQSGSWSRSSLATLTGSILLFWAGDDRDTRQFIRLKLNVPQGAKIQSAILYLESDQEQLQIYQGTTFGNLAVENTSNSAPVFASQDLIKRPYLPPAPVSFTGNWHTGDEYGIDVTSYVQQIVSRPDFVAGNFALFYFYSAVPNQQTSRTAMNGATCAKTVTNYPCGPRIKIAY